MDGTTIVAVILLVGAFGFTIYALHHSGVDAALKVWGAMGTISGAIVSFYFTNSYNHKEIQQANLQKDAAVLALKDAAHKATEANKVVAAWASALGDSTKPAINVVATPGGEERIIASMPETNRTHWAEEFRKASVHLNEIDRLNARVSKEPTSDTGPK